MDRSRRRGRVGWAVGTSVALVVGVGLVVGRPGGREREDAQSVDTPRAEARPRTPSSAPIDLAAVVDRVHFGWKPIADSSSYSIDHTTYTGRANASGVEVVGVRSIGRRERDGSRAIEKSIPFEIRLESIRMADQTRAASAADEVSVDSEGTLAIDRGDVLERFANGDDGIEQTFAIERRPAGLGDISVRLETRGMRYAGETERGLHFVDDRTGIGFVYGHGTFVDAEGTRTAVPSRFDDGAIALVVPSDVVASATYPAVIDPIIGTEYGIDTPIAGPAGGSQNEPSVAALGTGWLVVWTEDRASVGGGTDIWGTRVASDGSVTDPYGLVISSGTFNQRHPEVASRGSEALVVWEDTRASAPGFRDIWGARVGTDGVPIETNGFPIAVAAWDQRDPDVAWNGTDYLVVWQDGRFGGADDIFGNLVTSGGGVTDTSGASIVTTTGYQRAPQVASNGTDFFVAWQDERAGFNKPDVYGVRVLANGMPQTTNGIVVSNGMPDQLDPAVAALGTGYIAVWTDYRNVGTTGPEIWGARVDSSGVVQDASGFLVATENGSEHAPRIASNGSNYVVSFLGWNGTDEDVLARRLDSAGGSLDVTPLTVFGGAGSPSSVDIAANGTTYLFVDGDPRSTDDEGDEVYAARLDATPLPDGNGFRLTTSANGQSVASVASNGTHYFVVFLDTRGSSKFAVYGARLDAEAQLVGSALEVVPASTGYIEVPTVGSNGTDFLVAWSYHEPSVESDLFGRIVSGAGAFSTPPFTISDAAGYQYSAAIASVGTNYYVVFRDDHLSNTTIIAGTSISSTGVVATPDGGTVCDHVGYKYSVSIASNGSSYYAVWQDERSGVVPDVFGTGISGLGVVANTDGVPIVDVSNYQNLPSVVADATDFFVAWVDSRVSPAQLFGTRISGTFTIADPDGVQLTTAATSISDYGLASNGSSFLAYWERYVSSTDTDVVGTRILGDTVEVPAGESLIGVASSIERNPIIGSGIDDRFLLAYDRFIPESPFATTRSRVRILEFDSMPGTPCISGAECGSGYCVDAVCCATDCPGGSNDCMACSTAAGAPTNGTCAPRTNTSPCSDGSSCTSGDSCTSGSCVSGANPCSSLTTCTPGQPGTYTCGPCPGGMYSVTGSGTTTCMNCNAGSFSAAGATSCTSWTACTSSEFQVSAGSSTADRVCQACTVCAPSDVVLSACTATADTVCMSTADAGVDAGMDAGVDAGTMADAGSTPSDSGVVVDIDASSDGGSGDGGDEADASLDVSSHSSGCGCDLAGRAPMAPFPGLAAIVSVVLALARRRRARR